jgi:beta-lactamase class D
VGDEVARVGLLLIALWSAPAAAVQQPRLAAGECVVVAALDGASADRVFGGDECNRRTLPASTFKVPHAVIGLATGVITPETVLKWDGQKHAYASWQRDHDLDSAMKNSVLWFFQRIARAVGREGELQHLRAFAYGSQSFAREVDRFWINGDLTISPREQVAFLKRMFSDDLPVDRRHIETVKAAMTMPPGKVLNAAGTHPFPLAWPQGTIVRLKTGNGGVADERASWVIGAIESGGRSYVFASRVRSSTRPLPTTAGADLAVRVLNTIAPPRVRTRVNRDLTRRWSLRATPR